LVSSGWPIQFILVGKGLVPFHPDFPVGDYSIAKLIFHFIGNLLGKRLGRL
jgi:hypothetical protein